jgi:hypothetical protein
MHHARLLWETPPPRAIMRWPLPMLGVPLPHLELGRGTPSPHGALTADWNQPQRHREEGMTRAMRNHPQRRRNARLSKC